MDIIEAIILGLVQGLTEFLPVSSSGHLILLERLGLSQPSITTNVFLHLGTLLSVLTVYGKKLWSLIKNPFSKEVGFYLLACVPTGIIALLMKRYLNGWLLGDMLPACFMLTAVMLVMSDFTKSDRIRTLNNKTALLTGIFQGLAVLPGVSRSGATVSALTYSGVERERAAEFSFILSVPTILLATVLELAEGGFSQIDFLPLAIGMFVAYVSGYFAIKLMLKVITKNRLWPFSIYLVAISVASFILLY